MGHLLRGRGVSHVVMLEDHHQLLLAHSRRAKQQEAQTLISNRQLSSLLCTSADDIETCKQVVDAFITLALEGHEFCHRAGPLFLTELSPALGEAMHEECHRCRLIAVDEAPLDEDVWGPLLHVFTGHAGKS